MLGCIKIHIYNHVKLIALACHHMVLASQQPTKCHTKKYLEFENNAVGRTTFAGQLTYWLGIPYMYN